MAKSRKAAPVMLTDWQRDQLECLWFVYGNHGPKTTPGNHQFIQGLLEHGLDLRPLQTKRTAKRDIPTEECVAAVEAVLSSSGDDVKGITRFGLLRLVTSPPGGHQPITPDPLIKGMLDEMRRRLSVNSSRGELDSGGKDAA
jgi:hypothetical protein